MRIFIASDHAGFDLKQRTYQLLKSNFKFLSSFFLKKEEIIKFIDYNDYVKNHDDNVVVDVGPYEKNNNDDYPDFAKRLCDKLIEVVPKSKTEKQNNFGILICGTGIGMCMVANRYEYIRAAVCKDEKDAEIARKHNNANVICIGARKRKFNNSYNLMIYKFITTEYEGGRHDKRIEKF